MESAPTGLIDITILSVGVGAFDDPNIVGDDILGVPFIKISLHFARTTTWQAASFLRKHCGRPYGFDCFLDICL